MFIITATFEAEQAIARASELLALGDSPERLAEKLGMTRDLDVVKEGVANVSFKRVVTDIVRLQQYIEIERQIVEVKTGKSMLSFLGSGFKEKQLTKLRDERRKFGSLIEAPRWFYKQPRVRLLSAIRDYALDGSQQGDAAWAEIDEKRLVFPIAAMFESADKAFAEELAAEMEKPLKDIDPHFLFDKFEGHRSISFDFETSVVLYYTPAPSHPS
jgi:hypothetical protein